MKLARIFVFTFLYMLFPSFSGASVQFVNDCKRLTVAPHRLTGTKEALDASRYIENRLRRIGAGKVLVQEFKVAKLVTKRCEIEISSSANGNQKKVYPLFLIRPNGIVPSVTPPEGLSGEIIYAKRGSLEDYYKNGSVEGKIVVLDYDVDKSWLNAFRMGAKAVIFVRNNNLESMYSHYVETNANLPRYFYNGAVEDLLKGNRAVIKSEAVWETGIGRNVFCFIEGTAPKFNLGKEEMVILSAPLDSYGEVPELSKGARGATNCAGLLKIAEKFKYKKPKRHILLSFFDAQARGHAGVSAFYTALENDKKFATVYSREQYLELEKKFIEKILWVLEQTDPLNQKTDIQKQLFDMLKKKADEHIFAVVDTLDLLSCLLDSENVEHRNNKDDVHTLCECELEKDNWNSLRRSLSNMLVDTGDLKLNRLLKIILHEVKEDILLRQRELITNERNLRFDKEIKNTIGKYWINFHSSLLIGDKTSRWGVIIGGDSRLHSLHDKSGLYGRIQKCFFDAYNKLGSLSKTINFETASVDGSIDKTRSLWGAPHLIHSGEVAGNLDIYNIVFGTCQENIEREGTPDDVLKNLNLSSIEKQIDGIGLLFRAVIDEDALSLLHSIIPIDNYFMTEFGPNGSEGPVVMSMKRGSNIPSKPMPGAVIQLGFLSNKRSWPTGFSYQPVKPYAFDNFQTLISDKNGNYSYGPVVDSSFGLTLKFDNRGEVLYASDPNSQKTIYDSYSYTQRIVSYQQNIYPVKHGALVVLPSIIVGNVKIMDAVSHEDIKNSKSRYVIKDGVVSWFVEDKIKTIKLFGNGYDPSIVCLTDNRCVVDDELTKIDYKGVGNGIPVSVKDNNINVTKRSAIDLWRLTEYRMKLLRSKGATNNSLDELHYETEDLLLKSEENFDNAKGEAFAASAFMNEKPVYIKINDIFNDLIYAVLFLLILSIPFAYAMERLVFGSTTIGKRVAGFILFFSLTLIALYYTHPAFGISSTPFVVFLGFLLVAFSSFVIVLLMHNFKAEVKRLQGMSLNVHNVEVSRLNTIVAAMSMGISTMRRRPIRTFLTTITIVLLTFTILSFASFGTVTGVVKVFLSPLPHYAGVQLHKPDWKELDSDLLDLISERWDGEFCPRYWVAPENRDDYGIVVSHSEGGSPVVVKGVLGISQKELKCKEDLKNLLYDSKGMDSFENSIWITYAVAKKLNAKTGDELLVCGHKLKLSKILDSKSISMVKDLDESSILPMDFAEISAANKGAGFNVKQEYAAGGGENFSRSLRRSRKNTGWSNLSGDECVIVSSNIAKRIGAKLVEINLYSDDTKKTENMAEQFAKMFPIPIVATQNDGVYLYVLGPIVKANGIIDLLFPIILGGLVIFGTMLGSVVDREKEIYSFSALGLAPVHVTGLFFAEAMIYSVVGGMGGYVFANIVFKVMGFLSGYGIFNVPEINYSSSNAVLTMIIIMATVLISTIYPAIKASKNANPGGIRSWTLPVPDGDVLNINFPFTVSTYDMAGVLGFLEEHFNNFTDKGLGVFIAKDVEIVKEDEKSFGIKALLAIAPFDLGVTQYFYLRSLPSEIPGVDEIVIRINKRSGQKKDWQRLNKTLLSDLRKQFLIWRSISPELMEQYRLRALNVIGKFEKEKDRG